MAATRQVTGVWWAVLFFVILMNINASFVNEKGAFEGGHGEMGKRKRLGWTILRLPGVFRSLHASRRRAAPRRYSFRVSLSHRERDVAVNPLYMAIQILTACARNERFPRRCWLVCLFFFVSSPKESSLISKHRDSHRNRLIPIFDAANSLVTLTLLAANGKIINYLATLIAFPRSTERGER